MPCRVFFSLKLAQPRQTGFGVFSSKQLALPSGWQLSGLVSLQLNSPVCSRYSAQCIWCPVLSGKGNSQYQGHRTVSVSSRGLYFSAA